MENLSTKWKVLSTIVLSGVVMAFWQNCSQVGFDTVPLEGGVHKLAVVSLETPPSGGTPDSDPQDPVDTPPLSDPPTLDDPPASLDDPPASDDPPPIVSNDDPPSTPDSDPLPPEDPQDDPPSDNPPQQEPSQQEPSQQDPPHGQSQPEIVECDLGGPSSKIASRDGLIVAQHSNAASQRICMSRDACLNLINAYASDRNCSLSSGAATSPGAGGQCTHVFPGSRGTCKHSTVVSDADIISLLLSMGSAQ